MPRTKRPISEGSTRITATVAASPHPAHNIPHQNADHFGLIRPTTSQVSKQQS